ncbi:MAG: hypothetical protein L6Q76_09445, partial [Polyangiaceae bacterium]|nr:hypothetical protein [Polyangiaceae bacterium]
APQGRDRDEPDSDDLLHAFMQHRAGPNCQWAPRAAAAALGPTINPKSMSAPAPAPSPSSLRHVCLVSRLEVA